MIVERATHPQFLSNTYLVADGEGGPAFFVDAGGPVEPLIEAAERLGLTPTHVLLTHHHFDHVSEVGKLRERWPELEVLISPRERELLEGADAAGAGAAAESGERPTWARSRPARRCGSARSRCARCTRPGTRPGCSRSSWASGPERSGGERDASPRCHERRARRSRRRGAVVFTGDTLFKDSVGGVRAPGHTTYTDLRDSIMGTLMELPPDTVIYPGHAEATHGRAGVGLQRLHPRLARPRPGGLGAVHGARRARHAGAARAPTTTAARRRGCAGRTAPTTSCPGRGWSADG